MGVVLPLSAGCAKPDKRCARCLGIRSARRLAQLRAAPPVKALGCAGAFFVVPMRSGVWPAAITVCLPAHRTFPFFVLEPDMETAEIALASRAPQDGEALAHRTLDSSHTPSDERSPRAQAAVSDAKQPKLLPLSLLIGSRAYTILQKRSLAQHRIGLVPWSEGATPQAGYEEGR